MDQLIKVEKTDLDRDDLANPRRDFSSPELTKSHFEDLWQELAKLKEELSREHMYYKKLEEKYQSNSLKIKQIHLNNDIMLSTNQPHNMRIGNNSQQKFKQRFLSRSVKKLQHGNGLAPPLEKVNILIPSNLECGDVGNEKAIRQITRKHTKHGYDMAGTVNKVLGVDHASASSGHLKELAHLDATCDGKVREQNKAGAVKSRSLKLYVIKGGMKQQGAVKQDSTEVLHLKVSMGRQAADGRYAGNKQLFKNLVIRTDKNMKRLLEGRELEKLLMSPTVKLKRVDVNEKCVAVRSLKPDETCVSSPVNIKDKPPGEELNAAKTLSEVIQTTKLYQCIMNTSQEMVITLKLTKEQPRSNSSVIENTGIEVNVSHKTSHNRTRTPGKTSERNSRYRMEISSKPSKLCQDASRKLCEPRGKSSSNLLKVSRKRLSTRPVPKRGNTGQRRKLGRDKSLPVVIKPNKLTEFTNHRIKIEKNSYKTHHHTSEIKLLNPYHLSDKNLEKCVALNVYNKKKHLLPFSETSFVTDGHTTAVVSHSKINSELSETSTVKQWHKQNTVQTSEIKPQKNSQEDGHFLQNSHYKESLGSSFVQNKSQVTTCLDGSLENRGPRSKMKRRHRCKVCRKCFGSVHQLIRHVKQVHQLPFYCRSCRTHFSTDSEYRIHLESHYKAENRSSSEISLAPSCINGTSVKKVENVKQAQIKDKEKEEDAERCSGKEFGPTESRSVKTIGLGICETEHRVHKANENSLETDTQKKRKQDTSAEMLSISLSNKMVNGETIRGKDFAHNLRLLWIDSLEEKIAEDNLGVLELFCCESCSVKFQSIGQLERHTQSISKTLCNRFGCGKCHASFTTLMSLWNHVFDCHLTKLYGSDNCDKTFDKQTNCAEHLLAHTDKKANCAEHPLVHADKKANCAVNLLVHADKKASCAERPLVHADKKASCAEHPLVHADKKANCAEHSLAHADKKPNCAEHPLAHADKKTNCAEHPLAHADKKANCAEHLLAHADVDQNSCERCGRSFKSVLQLNRHQYSVCRAKFGDGEKSFNERIKTSNALTKSSPFQCSSSKKLFCGRNNSGKIRTNQFFETLILPKDKFPEHLKMLDCDEDDFFSDNDLYSFNEEDSSDEEWSIKNWKQELKRNNRFKRSRKVQKEMKVDRKTSFCS